MGGDPDKDVAVLQLLDMPPEKMRELKPVSLGVSSTLMVGQRCASFRIESFHAFARDLRPSGSKVLPYSLSHPVDHQFVEHHTVQLHVC